MRNETPSSFQNFSDVFLINTQIQETLSTIKFMNIRAIFEMVLKLNLDFIKFKLDLYKFKFNFIKFKFDFIKSKFSFKRDASKGRKIVLFSPRFSPPA